MRRVTDWKIRQTRVTGWASSEHPDPFANDVGDERVFGCSTYENCRRRPRQWVRLRLAEATQGRFRGVARVCLVQRIFPHAYELHWEAVGPVRCER